MKDTKTFNKPETCAYLLRFKIKRQAFLSAKFFKYIFLLFNLTQRKLYSRPNIGKHLVTIKLHLT